MSRDAEVWAALEADPEFVAGMAAGMADFQAGRTFRMTHDPDGRSAFIPNHVASRVAAQDTMPCLCDDCRTLGGADLRVGRSTSKYGASLSVRELQVLALIRDGGTNRTTAAALGISEDTIKNYLSQIFDKLGVSTRTNAVVEAVRSGQLPLEHFG